MKILKTKQILAVMVSLLTYSLLTTYSYCEATGASFLKIGVGARAVGLGNAFTAISNDVTAMCYNPGGLYQLEKREVSAMYSQWIADSNVGFVGFASPIHTDNRSLNTATIGGSILMLNNGQLEGRDENRQATGSFGASDLAATVCYSKPMLLLGEKVGFGMNLKLIQEKIEAESATGLAFDVGMLYNFSNLPLSAGFAVQNLGPQMKFISEGYNLPLSASFGLGYTRGYMTVALDFKRQIHEGNNIISLGTEFSPFKALSLRAGYLGQGAQGGQADNAAGSGLGGGIGINLFGTQTDYSFVPYGVLGDTQRISFSTKF